MQPAKKVRCGLAAPTKHFPPVRRLCSIACGNTFVTLVGIVARRIRDDRQSRKVYLHTNFSIVAY